MKLNGNFHSINDSYLFSTIARKVDAFTAAHPDAPLIRLGIGDVTLPLCAAVTRAMQAAVAEMGEKAAFRGYGPEQGYDFLNDAVRGYYAGVSGVELAPGEVFISDGAKSDLGNILDLFAADNTVLIPDPVYPVYVDTNIMAGRRIAYLDANAANGFLPLPTDIRRQGLPDDIRRQALPDDIRPEDSAAGEDFRADIIYLCSPNNPTGAVYDREQLEAWVDYANDCGAVILFDAAYEAFVRDPALPRSIYEIEGARTCAIEFCSLSKTAGFTGTRCGYTVVPAALEREGAGLNKMWLRRQTTKFNGVPYVVQRGAAAVFTDEGQKQVKENLAYYMANAAIIADALRAKGVWFTGGDNSPYIWLSCPDDPRRSGCDPRRSGYGLSSWEYFDYLLNEKHVVGTPGAGFGRNGEGYFRLTAFGDRDKTAEAVKRVFG